MKKEGMPFFVWVLSIMVALGALALPVWAVVAAGYFASDAFVAIILILGTPLVASTFLSLSDGNRKGANQLAAFTIVFFLYFTLLYLWGNGHLAQLPFDVNIQKGG